MEIENMENYYKEYINNYSLTANEYCLLPYKMRLAYMHSKYSDVISGLKLGESKKFLGFISPCYREYFEACGCEITGEEGFGNIQHEIKKVCYSPYQPTEEELKLIGEYVKEVAKVRWKTFESIIRDKMLKGLANLSNHKVDFDFKVSDYTPMLEANFLESDLPQNIKNKIIRKEIKTIVSDEVLANKHLSSEYYDVDVLDRIGYEAFETEKNVKIRKLNVDNSEN